MMVSGCITREDGEDKESFLFKLFNTGHIKMRLAYNYEKNGELLWSRWVSYEHLSSLEQHEKVKGTIDTRESFIRKCTHRTIHPCEIVYDIDDKDIDITHDINGFLVWDFRCFKDIKEHAKYIASTIKEHFVVWWTGNKSYHIHSFDPRLAMMSEMSRKLYREERLMILGADVQKASDNAMIAIEGEPHYRSGKNKCRVVI